MICPIALDMICPRQEKYLDFNFKKQKIDAQENHISSRNVKFVRAWLWCDEGYKSYKNKCRLIPDARKGQSYPLIITMAG